MSADKAHNHCQEGGQKNTSDFVAKAAAYIAWGGEHGAEGDSNTNLEGIQFYPNDNGDGKGNSQKYRLGKIGAFKEFQEVFNGSR